MKKWLKKTAAAGLAALLLASLAGCGNDAKKAEEGKAEAMIGRLYSYFLEHPEQMPEEYRYFMSECKQPIERTVCDYIAGMSDQYAVRVFQELFVPRAWTVL